MSIAYLGLGSNIGDRQVNLQAAVNKLKNKGIKIIDSSSIYETEPIGEVTEQREFFNACLKIDTDLGPEQLLELCKDIEQKIGRKAGPRHGPRLIDIDLLLLNNLIYSSERLTLPHPLITKRRFVLVPLLEIDYALETPAGILLSESLTQLGSEQQIQRLDLTLKV